MSKIEIKVEYIEQHCDDCGYYDDKKIVVYKDGEIVYDAYDDNHFGNSAIPEKEVLISDILTALGIEFDMEVTTDPCDY